MTSEQSDYLKSLLQEAVEDVESGQVVKTWFTSTQVKIDAGWHARARDFLSILDLQDQSA